jgi:hypothetical protein
MRKVVGFVEFVVAGQNIPLYKLHQVKAYVAFNHLFWLLTVKAIHRKCTNTLPFEQAT